MFIILLCFKATVWLQYPIRIICCRLQRCRVCADSGGLSRGRRTAVPITAISNPRPIQHVLRHQPRFRDDPLVAAPAAPLVRHRPRLSRRLQAGGRAQKLAGRARQLGNHGPAAAADGVFPALARVFPPRRPAGSAAIRLRRAVWVRRDGCVRAPASVRSASATVRRRRNGHARHHRQGMPYRKSMDSLSNCAVTGTIRYDTIRDAILTSLESRHESA